MTKIESLLVWLGGYSPLTVVSESPEERERIAKIGGVVLFAITVAILNWGIAGWVFSEGATTTTHLVMTLLTSVLGGSLVLCFDRSFIYFHDTAKDGTHTKTILYGLFRALIIFAVGSITSQAVMPVLLGDELRAHALHMIEDGEKNRTSELSSLLNVNDKLVAVRKSEEKVNSLEKAASTIPPDIQQHLLAAKICRSEYGKEKDALILSGHTTSEATNTLIWKASICSRETKDANAERNIYLERTRFQLAKAITGLDLVKKDLADTNASIKSRVDHAKKVEVASFNPQNSIILWSLLCRNPGAMVKWAIIAFLLLACELLPLLQKLQAGQSNIGRRIAFSRGLARIKMDERMIQHEHDFEISLVVQNISKNAMKDAIRNPAIMEIFQKCFESYVSAIAPVEAVRTMMAELETKTVDIKEFMFRYPKYASLISQAWSKAVKDSANMLANGGRMEAGAPN